jgi:pyruvate dehydrogenase E1 component alpha subunit
MKTCYFGESLGQALHYTYNKVRGFYIYNGQEAVLAGALRNGLDKDRMITAYRNHVQPIGMGVDPKRVMAELWKSYQD